MIKYTSQLAILYGVFHVMQQSAPHDVYEMLLSYLQHGYSISRLRRRAFQLSFGCPDLCLRKEVPNVTASDAGGAASIIRFSCAYKVWT